MAFTKILYIANEINPFIKNSATAKLIKHLAAQLVKKKIEVRIMVPRFGTINQRINSIHEVLRLSGINITVGTDQYSLLVKVASIRDAKLQVYFIDNEELFERKGKILDKEQKFYSDNDARAIFFCKGVLSTVKRQEWSPDIIHCAGWYTSLIPLYIKTTYKASPLFKNTKVVYNLQRDVFSPSFNREEFIKKAKLREVQKLHFDMMEEANFSGISQLAMHYADKVTHSFQLTPEDPKPLQALLRKSYYTAGEDNNIDEGYLPLYQKLHAESENK